MFHFTVVLQVANLCSGCVRNDVGGEGIWGQNTAFTSSAAHCGQNFNPAARYGPRSVPVGCVWFESVPVLGVNQKGNQRESNFFFVWREATPSKRHPCYVFFLIVMMEVQM